MKPTLKAMAEVDSSGFDSAQWCLSLINAGFIYATEWTTPTPLCGDKPAYTLSKFIGENWLLNLAGCFSLIYPRQRERAGPLRLPPSPVPVSREARIKVRNRRTLGTLTDVPGSRRCSLQSLPLATEFNATAMPLISLLFKLHHDISLPWNGPRD